MAKKFRFSLQSVLEHRERLRDAAEGELGLAYAKLEQLRRKKQDILDEMEQAVATRPNFSAILLAQHIQWLQDLKKRENQSQESIDQQKLEIEKKRKLLVHAEKELRAIEILKENQLKEFKQEQNKKELLFLDEMATIRHSSPLILLFVALTLLWMPSQAGTHSLSFSLDFAGQTTDSNSLNDDWSGGLKLAVNKIIFLPVIDTILNNAIRHDFAAEQYGSTPLIATSGDDSFKTMFLWYIKKPAVTDNIEPHNNFHLIFDVNVENRSLHLLDTAAVNTFSSATGYYKNFYAGGTGGAGKSTAPISTDFFAQDNRWIAQWSNDTNYLGPTGRYSWRQDYPTGSNHINFLYWPCEALPSATGGCAYDTLRAGGVASPRNYLRMAMAPLGKSLDTVVTVFGPAKPQDNRPTRNYITLRWEVPYYRTESAQPIRQYLFAMDSIAVPTYAGLYHVAVATDENQRSLVAYSGSNGRTLELALYNNNFKSGTVTKLASSTLPVSIDVGTTTADTLSRHFSLANIGPDLYGLVYTRDNIVRYRAISYIGSSIHIDYEQTVGETGSYFPELSVNNDYAAIAYLRKNGTSLKAHFARYKLTNLGNLIANPQKVEHHQNLTYNTVTQNVRPLNARIAANLHLPTRPSVGVNASGSVLMGFNQERNARIVSYGDRYLYLQSGFWHSQNLNLIAPGVSTPVLASDSIQFNPPVAHGQNLNKVKVAVRKKGSATDLIPNQAYGATGDFQTHITLNPVDSFVTPVLSGVDLAWNFKPRKPSITAVVVGNQASQSYSANKVYPVVNRRDSVKIQVKTADLDNHANLKFNIHCSYISPRYGQPQSCDYTANLTANSDGAGNYTTEFKVSPLDLVADSLFLSITATDPSWSSEPVVLKLKYFDEIPLANVRVLWLDGQGSLRDSVMNRGEVRRQVDDRTQFRVFVNDLNDPQLRVVWQLQRSGQVVYSDSTMAQRLDTVNFRIPLHPLDYRNGYVPRSDSLHLTPDLLTIMLRDPDTTISHSLTLIPNHKPWLDSIRAVGFFDNGTYHDTVIGRWKKNDDPPYLSVVPGVPVKLYAHGRDLDSLNADKTASTWEVLLQNPAQPNLWISDYQTTRDTLEYAFPPDPKTQLAMVRTTITDLNLDERVDTIYIVYPRIDTTGGWEVSLTYLQDSVAFVIGSDKTQSSRRVEVRNIGSIDLHINAIYTKLDNGAWLSYLVERPGMATVQDNTHVNRLTTPLRLRPGDVLPVRFNFDVSNMSGDQVVTDTLYLATNDYLTPFLKVPFRVRWDDLPQMSIFTRITSDLKGELHPLRPYFPVNHSLVFAFSEPVMRDSISKNLKVYSRLDSLARGIVGITPMESAYPGQFKYVQSATNKKPKMVDTVIFTPNYLSPSDHFNHKPPPYAFVRHDNLGIYLRNAILDSSGNHLDLRKNRKKVAVGSLDTTLTFKADTSTLRVVRTWPEDLGTFDPDDDIRILFSQPLTKYAVFGPDSFMAMDLHHLKSVENTTIALRSRYSRYIPLDFRNLRLERGDSLLVIRPRYKFLSQDTVRVWLAPSFASPLGHTLDGNGDGTTLWPTDSVDAFEYRFTVGPTKFYTFPNPFKASHPEHREKGTITFKNLHQIAGVTLEKNIKITIHNVVGTLIYSTTRQKETLNFEKNITPPQFDWDLRNNHGYPVASGTYIFTVSQDDKVLHQSKLMVIR